MTETAAARRRTMQAVKSKDTAPELLVRKLAHRLGFRFRLHRRDLPGTPDLAFIGRRKVVFVHGCFWHAHGCARGARMPKRNHRYWAEKISRNEVRDRRNQAALAAAGWEYLVLWECELRDLEAVGKRLTDFLN